MRNFSIFLIMRRRGYFTDKCGRCGGPKESHRVGRYSYCNKCHAAYMRETRPKHSELSPDAKQKANARAYAHVYRDRGKIKKEDCKTCGSSKSEMHHSDYSKPLEVTWLCRSCHLKEHAIISSLSPLSIHSDSKTSMIARSA